MSTTMTTTLPTMTVPSLALIQGRFEALLPELQSRARAIARSVDATNWEEVSAEVLAMAWANFQQAAHRGRWLNPRQLSWFAWAFVRSGRSLAGDTAADAMGALTQRRGRSRIVSIEAMTANRGSEYRAQKIEDRLRRDYALATSGSDREETFVRAQLRLDWADLARKLPRRLRQVLFRRARGDRPSEIAQRLKVSRGRISQLLGELRGHVLDHFSGDVAL